MQTERKKKSARGALSLSCGCTAAANAVRICDGIDRWRAPYLPPLLRVPWNPTTRYTSAIKPANAKARQIAGASRKRRRPNGFSLRWEKKKPAAKGPFGLEEQPESNGSSLVSITQEDARWFCSSLGLPCTLQEGESFPYANQLAAMQRRVQGFSSTVLGWVSPNFHAGTTWKPFFSQIYSIDYKNKIVDAGNKCCCPLQSYSNWL